MPFGGLYRFRLMPVYRNRNLVLKPLDNVTRTRQYGYMSTAAETIAATTVRLTDAGYTPYPTGSGRVTIRRGSLVASLYPERDGSVFVSMVIDYGDHGHTFCEGANLKSAAGIVRRVSKFLGAAA